MLDKDNKIILIADFGRSGQGWLSYMLCYILNARFIEPYNFAQGRKYSYSDYIIKLTSGNLPNREKTKYSLVVKTHNYPAQDLNLTDKIIFLTRDPRDVAVSMWHWQVLSEKKINWGNFLGKLYLKLITKIRIISYFLTIRAWEKHFKAWKRVNYFRVRYEELVESTFKTLKNILDYLEVFVEEEIIKEAVENFSFEKITGRKRGEEDRGNPEFRKGIVGDYKNYFSKLELRIINTIFKNIFKESGYEI